MQVWAVGHNEDCYSRDGPTEQVGGSRTGSPCPTISWKQGLLLGPDPELVARWSVACTEVEVEGGAARAAKSQVWANGTDNYAGGSWVGPGSGAFPRPRQAGGYVPSTGGPPASGAAALRDEMPTDQAVLGRVVFEPNASTDLRDILLPAGAPRPRQMPPPSPPPLPPPPSPPPPPPPPKRLCYRVHALAELTPMPNCTLRYWDLGSALAACERGSGWCAGVTRLSREAPSRCSAARLAQAGVLALEGRAGLFGYGAGKFELRVGPLLIGLPSLSTSWMKEAGAEPIPAEGRRASDPCWLPSSEAAGKGARLRIPGRHGAERTCSGSQLASGGCRRAKEGLYAAELLEEEMIHPPKPWKFARAIIGKTSIDLRPPSPHQGASQRRKMVKQQALAEVVDQRRRAPPRPATHAESAAQLHYLSPGNHQGDWQWVDPHRSRVRDPARKSQWKPSAGG